RNKQESDTDTQALEPAHRQTPQDFHALSLSRGPLLDPLFRMRIVHEPVNKDAWRMNLIGIEFAWFYDDLRFGNRDLAAGGGRRIEVARGAAIDQVAVRIGLPGLHQCQIGLNAALQDVGHAVEFLVLFAFRYECAYAGACVKTGNAGATGAHPFRQGPLRTKLHFKLAGEILSFELGVLAYIAGDHFPDLPRFQQQSKSTTVHAGVVAGDGQVAHARLAQRENQRFRNAAQTKAANRQQHAVMHHAFERSSGIRPEFVQPAPRSEFIARFRHPVPAPSHTKPNSAPYARQKALHQVYALRGVARRLACMYTSLDSHCHGSDIFGTFALREVSWKRIRLRKARPSAHPPPSRSLPRPLPSSPPAS